MADRLPRRPVRPSIRRTALALALSAPLAAHATGQSDEADEPPPSPIESTEQAIDPDTRPPETSIATRLRQILEATDSFQDLAIDVDHGVVFLRGVALDVTRRDWASEVASRVTGVAAVVNDLDVAQPAYFDLGPARRSASRFARESVRALPLLVAGLVVVLLGVLAARGASAITTRWLTDRLESEILRATISRGLALVVFALAAYMGLEVAGLTGLAATVVGGTGLVGLAFGFAFSDIAENFLSGVLLSVQRPFRVGDTIEVDGYRGVVRRVSSHGTSLIDFDGNAIELSNTTVYKGAVRNFTSNPKTRIEFSVGVGYDMEARDAQAIVLEVVRASDLTLDEPEPIALVSELGASSVVIKVYSWIDGHRHSLLRVRSKLLREVLEALDRAGAPMPDEAREVVFPNEVPIRLLREGRDADVIAPMPPKDRPVSRAPEVADPEGDMANETEELERQARATEGQDAPDDLLTAEARPRA